MRTGLFSISTFVNVGQGSSNSNIQLPMSFFGMTEEQYKSPVGAFTGIHGAINTRRLIAKQSGFILGNGIYPSEVSVNVHEISGVSEIIEEKQLASVNGVNLTRIKADLLVTVREVWAELLKRAKVPKHIREGDEALFPRYGTRYPHLISRLREVEGFEHLDLIVYPVKFSNMNTMVASYFKPELISNSDIRSDSGIVTL